MRFLLIFFFLLVLAFAIIRPVNPDEPYYTISSSLVMEGKVPYIDFLFHQMPLTIYIYSLVSEYGYWSLVLGRFISVIFIFIGYFLIYKNFILGLNNKKLTILFTIMFFTNGFFLDWTTIIRVYALSIFLLTLGIIFFHIYVSKEHKEFYLMLSSICFTLLVFVKIVFAANLALFLIYSLYLLIKKGFKLSGLLLVSAPVVIIFLIFSGYFVQKLDFLYFNLIQINNINKTYHLFSFKDALIKYFSFFLIPQNFIIVFILFVSGFKYDFFERFLLLNILIYVLTHILAQMLPEYLCVILPMLLYLTVKRFNYSADNLTKIFKSLTLNKAIWIVYILFSVSVPVSDTFLRNYLEGKKEFMPNAYELYRLDKKISGIEGVTVLSSWWGYSVYSGKKALYPVDYISYYINNFVSEDEILKYNIKKRIEYKELISKYNADIIIYDKNNPLYLEEFADNIENDYTVNTVLGDVIIYSKMK